MGKPTLADFEELYKGQDLAHLVSVPEQISASFFIICVVVPSVVFGLGAMVFEDSYRKHPMITKRSLLLVLVEILSASISITAHCVPYALANQVTAGVAVSLNSFFVWVSILTCVYRLWTLSVTLMINAQFARQRSDTNTSDLMKNSLWIRSRKFRKFPYHITTIFTCAISAYIPSFIFLLQSEKVAEKSFFAYHYVYGTQEPFSAYGLFGFAFVASFILWRKMKQEGVENFGIQKELAGKVYVVGFLVLSLFIGGATPVSFQVKYFHPQLWGFALAYMVDVYVSVWRVLYNTEKEIKKFSGHSRNSSARSSDVYKKPGTKVSLELVFEDDHLLELFREFLCRELCVEQLYFVEAVNAFHLKYVRARDSRWMKRHKLSWQSYVEDATRIYNDFCDYDSIAPVNVSYQCRDEIKLKVDQLQALPDGIPDPDFFDRPYKDVSLMLAQDSLRRFKMDIRFVEYEKKVAAAGSQTPTRMSEKRFWAKPKHRKSASVELTLGTMKTSRRTSTSFAPETMSDEQAARELV